MEEDIVFTVEKTIFGRAIMLMLMTVFTALLLL